jgi:hypothetical protein
MIPLFFLLLIGCGDNSSAESTAKSTATESKSAPDKAEGFDPCELLNEKLVRSHFELGDAEITSRSSVQSRYATCRVIWPKPNSAQIQAEYKEKITEYSMAKAKGQDAEMPKHPRSDSEISITVPTKRFDSSAQAISALDTGLDILKNGLKSRPKDPARVALINIQPVEGLGDKAAWTTPNNQMSVANERRIFHLIVNVHEDSEANRAKAMDLAMLFLKDIR